MTTGSTLYGCIPGGLTKGTSQGTAANVPKQMTDKVLIVTGDPNDIVTVSVGSQLAYDVAGPNIYMGLAQTGSTWIRLGSCT